MMDYYCLARNGAKMMDALFGPSVENAANRCEWGKSQRDFWRDLLRFAKRLTEGMAANFNCKKFFGKPYGQRGT